MFQNRFLKIQTDHLHQTDHRQEKILVNQLMQMMLMLKDHNNHLELVVKKRKRVRL